MSKVQEPSTRNYLVTGMWAVIALLIVLFVANNSQSVDLDIAFTTATVPLWLLVVLAFAVGVGAGWVTRWWTGRR